MSPAEVFEIVHSWSYDEKQVFWDLMAEKHELELSSELIDELEARVDHALSHPETLIPEAEARKMMGFTP
jgi:hypothetical protein